MSFQINKSKKRKVLGQHFLHPKASQIIINYFKKVYREELIIEIGPGLGSLTNFIERTIPKRRLLLIEKDSLLIRRFMNLKFRILNNDACDIPGYIYKDKFIISNLPYSTSKRILKHIIISRARSILFLIQEEVGQKILDNRSLLSLLLYPFGTFQRIRKFDNTWWRPKPKVNGILILFQARKYPLIDPVKPLLLDNYINFIKVIYRNTKRKSNKILIFKEIRFLKPYANLRLYNIPKVILYLAFRENNLER